MSQSKPKIPDLFSLNVSFLCVSAVFFGSSFFIGDIDFSFATLLGSGVVAVNLIVTQQVMQRVFFSQKSKAIASLIYLFKFSLSAGLIFFAIKSWGFNPYGIVYGVSTLVVTILLFMVLKFFC